MKVNADGLGYRELDRLADFLKEVADRGIENVLNVVMYDEAEVTIGYNIYYDEVTIDGYIRSDYE